MAVKEETILGYEKIDEDTAFLHVLNERPKDLVWRAWEPLREPRIDTDFAYLHISHQIAGSFRPQTKMRNPPAYIGW